MGAPRFPPEFKEEAVKQVTERGHTVAGWGLRSRMALVWAAGRPTVSAALKHGCHVSDG
jgi:transposase-like protein